MSNLTDERQKLKKLLSPLNSAPSICAEYKILSKVKLLQLLLKAFVVLRPNLWPKTWQVPILTEVKIDKHQESQKIIATIEFTSLNLCRVRNFIKIEAFAVLRPKVRAKRGQLPTLTGVKSDKRQKLQKALATIEFTALDLCRVRNFIKI